MALAIPAVATAGLNASVNGDGVRAKCFCEWGRIGRARLKGLGVLPVRKRRNGQARLKGLGG